MPNRHAILALTACFVPGLLDAEVPVNFARDVLPILSNKCFVCHGPDTKKKDLVRLDSQEGATRDLGGYKAINPDEPEKSEILKRIHDPEDPMPPEKAEKKLTAAEREILSKWARQGGKYEKHWAFVPPTKAEGTIDSFIEAGQKAKGVDFAPEADKPTLARRVALVLTGLPPEPEQLSKYLAGTGGNAYGKLVDALMASPRYGEHQARYWLDAVRYGDTHGLHLDNKRGIYPYRDWVVKALNENQPLHEFITWQIAGDLLPNPTLEQRVATGYVRLNPTTAEGGAIPAEFQAKNNFDRVETLGTVFLGMSMTCARCHTHKYDPILQTEYYQLMAFFNSTAENAMDGNKYDYAPVVKAPRDLPGWQKLEALTTERDKLLAEAEAVLKDGEGADARKRLEMLAKTEGPLGGRAVELQKRIAELEKTFTTTLVAQDLSKPRKTLLLERGEYDKPTGDPLEADVPAVMGRLPEDASRDRLGLAKWLTARDHPLVARVLVNRIWQRVFGHALVRTPEDFGLQGEQPTHPELLDWLAVELHDSGWDLKHMLRLMVTSRTFKQSSAWRENIEDPENRLFARGPGHRLDAEVLRDIGLWASGLLDPHMGGEGVKPYQPAGLWAALMHPASNTKKYVKDNDRRVYRRSLYVYWKRTSPHPMMTLFDAPNRESSCVRRSRSNTSLQSLGLLNESQRVEMARKLGERLLASDGDDASRLSWLYGLLACRKPTAAESEVCASLLGAMRTRYSGDGKKDAMALLSVGDAPRDESLDPVEMAAWTQVAATVLASDAAILLY